MSKRLFGRTAAVVGRNHIKIGLKDYIPEGAPPLTITSFKNCQDAVATHFVNHNGVIEVAFVLHDGTSDGDFSESGALMLAEPAAIELAEAVRKYGVGSTLIGHHMYSWYLGAIRKMIQSHPYGEYYLAQLDLSRMGKKIAIDEDYRLVLVYNWIRHHLQFTIVMGYLGKDGFQSIIRGDGGFYVDGNLFISEYENVAPYFAYHFYTEEKLLEGIKHLESEGHTVIAPPPGFESHFYPNATCVAGFSDGMIPERIGEVWGLLDPVLEWNSTPRNRLYERISRRWWQEYLHPDMPSDGWLVADDLGLCAFKYEEEA